MGCFFLIVLAGKIKSRHHSLVFANLSALFGFIEIIFMLVFTISAFAIISWIVGLITLFALFPYIGTNIWMFFIFKKKVKNDKEYKNWTRKNRRTARFLPIISLLISFRLYKFFYSGFFGLKNC
jgi:amino acid transporter